MEARAQLNGGHTKDHIRLAVEAAQAALEHGGRTGDMAVQIAAIIERATIAWASGQMAEAEDLASAADHLLHKHQLSQQTERLLEGRMLGVRGICAESRGDIHAAREFFAMGERLLRLVGPSRDLALIQQNFGSFCNRTGDSATAQKLLAEAAAHWRLLQDRNGLATTENILGDLHLRLGNLEAAGAALKDALEAARAVGSVRIEGWTVVTLGQWHRASGRIRDAVECFDEGLHLAQDSDRELEVAAHVQRAEVALLQDEPETARTLLTQAQAAAQMLRSATAVASVERALGRLHLYEGGGTRAVQFFEAALQRAADTWDAHERAQTLYWLGTAHLHLRQMQTAGARLGEAVDIVERTGLASILGWPAAEDPRLLEYGLKLGLNPPVLREVERLSNLCQPWSGVRQAPLQVVAENPLPRLEVQLFGAFVLHRDGQLVDTGPRKIARARELLALLVLHPKGLADDLITDYMWPGMSPQSAQHNLHVAASNLRRVELQAKAAVRYSAGTYQLHPQLELVADVRAFDAALARGRGATGDQLVAELSKAVEIYRGDLLEDVNWRWVEPFRQAYRARFVGAALQLADLVAWVDARQSDALAERVLAVAPEMDVAYERLIQNARGRGDSMALQRLTRRYQQAAEQFAFTPDPRLVAGLGRHA
jgi:DNA-binding SARP family transcriptional activator